MPPVPRQNVDDFGYRVNVRIALWVIVLVVLIGLSVWWFST